MKFMTTQEMKTKLSLNELIDLCAFYRDCALQEYERKKELEQKNEKLSKSNKELNNIIDTLNKIVQTMM
jgi:hypothetical protein